MATNLYGKSCTPNTGGVLDFYTKSEVNTLLASKAGTSTTYTRAHIDGQLSSLSDSISSLSASAIDQTDLNTSLGDLQTEIEGDIAATYATLANTYTKTEVDGFINDLDLDPNTLLRKAPSTTDTNTIDPGSNDAVPLTLRGSSTNAIVQRWLDNSGDVIGYISNNGTATLEGPLTLGRLVSDGSAALDVSGRRITGLADPTSDIDAVPYAFLKTYVLDFYEEFSQPNPEPPYILNAGEYSNPSLLRDSYRHIRSNVKSKRPLPSDLLEGELAVNTNSESVGLFVQDTLGKIRKIGPAYIGLTPPSPTNYTDLSDGEMWIDKSGPAPILRYYDESGDEWIGAGIELTVSDSGGDGSLTYDEATGTLTYTGPSSEEVRSHFSGGTGVTITDGEISIAQSVSDSDSVTFVNTTLTGDLVFDQGTYEGTVTTDPLTENRTYTLPNVSGTLVTTGDTGTVTSTMIAEGTIVDADISANAEIAVSKLADGAARQLLQTDAAGTGVEWTSNIDVPGTLDVTGIATFDTLISIGAAEPTTSQQVGWNADKGTLDVGLLNGVLSPLGQDIITLCRNGTASPIPVGTAVMFTGETDGNSGRLYVAPMVADGTYPGYIFFGVAAQTIAVGEDGYIRSFGEVKGVDTDIDEGGVDGQWAEGDIIWCDPATPGGFTKFEPQAPNLKLPVAAVISVGSNGIVMVRWDTGRRLSDLHDVESNGSTADNELLAYNASAGRWEHKSDITIPGTLSVEDDTTVSGDITLDDGGTFVTTLQMVTPTQNRTISFPDATGTVALMAGSSGQLIYNNSGAQAGLTSANIGITGEINIRLAGAESIPPVSFTGSWFTGGTAATTKPQLLIEPTGTTSDSWSTGGTGIGVNAASGFAGNLLDLQVNGSSQFKVTGSSTYFPTGSTIFQDQTSPNGIVIGSYAGRGIYLGSATILAWNTSSPTSTRDLILLRDAANTLAQRNGTNAQAYRLYNTYTDASNYERGFLKWNSNVFEIGSEGAGTGSEQPVRITAATLKLPNLPTYADNAAATTGGLVAGDVYKTATGELRITV